MKPPISFIHGNRVFARGLDDRWAAFALELGSYRWLSDDAKCARLAALMAALKGAQADLQIVRVTRHWTAARRAAALGTDRGSAERAGRSHAGADRGDGDVAGRARERYVARQAARLQGLGAAEPLTFMFVSLSEPTRDIAAYAAKLTSARNPLAWWRALMRATSMRDHRILSAAELERARADAERVHARLAEHVSLRPANTEELQWLVRRTFCRGLGEPDVEPRHEPRALAFERAGEAMVVPLEGDVLRWTNAHVHEAARSLRIESELGISWQAQLALGALPEEVPFPGDAAELMFAPLESLPFAVDLSLTARYLPNDIALRIARRRIQDADHIARAESEGEQGLSDRGYERTQQARDLLAYLQASSKPPLLRTTLAVAVAAESQERLENRVEGVRRAYGELRLHRPLGDQLSLFIQHLPGQRTLLAGYDDTLTVDQVAAMMPTASHAAGSRRGFYLGHTLSRSRRPVMFDLREGSDSDRNTAILSVGSLGSGKTTLAQKLAYEAYLQGARVVDCDPKGDHRFHQLDEVAPSVECVPLRPVPALRGMLDPLRVAPEHLAHDAAVSFLRDLLPARADAAWETAIVTAVDRVRRRAAQPTCLEVVRALSDGDRGERAVGEALAVYARSGLTQLGFADPAVRLPVVGERRVTYLRIRDLPGPGPGTRRADYTPAERIGEQLVRLIALFAMHLLAADRHRLKVFSFDEGWRLLGDPAGRALLAALQRMGRSELAVPIVSTQQLSDGAIGEPQSLENLLGATFVFGMRSEAEAARALALLGLDPSDRGMRAAILALGGGRCLFRDHRGRIEAIQVDVVVPRLLRAFSTTPTR